MCQYSDEIRDLLVYSEVGVARMLFGVFDELSIQIEIRALVVLLWQMLGQMKQSIPYGTVH
jgi:hypothetical protein